MPTRAETATGRAPAGATPQTPRAQLARVLVGGVLAVVVGAGPAIAWDVSTQAPRAVARRPAQTPSPWRAAGRQMKAAVGGIARVYLPRSITPPVASEVAPAPAAAGLTPAPSATASTASALLAPYIIE